MPRRAIEANHDAFTEIAGSRATPREFQTQEELDEEERLSDNDYVPVNEIPEVAESDEESLEESEVRIDAAWKQRRALRDARRAVAAAGEKEVQPSVLYEKQNLNPLRIGKMPEKITPEELLMQGEKRKKSELSEVRLNDLREGAVEVTRFEHDADDTHDDLPEDIFEPIDAAVVSEEEKHIDDEKYVEAEEYEEGVEKSWLKKLQRWVTDWWYRKDNKRFERARYRNRGPIHTEKRGSEPLQNVYFKAGEPRSEEIVYVHKTRVEKRGKASARTPRYKTGEDLRSKPRARR